MKLITKTFLNFLVCWSMLFTQMVAARDRSFRNQGRNLNLSSGNYDVMEMNLGDLDEGLSELEKSQGATGACRVMESVDFQLTGINGLLDHFKGKSCWDNVRKDLEPLSDPQTGTASAVAVCNALVKVKESKTCPENVVMAPTVVESSLSSLRRNPEMRALEIDLKAKAFEEEVDKAAKVSKLQTLLSTDMHFVKYLYNKIKNATEEERKGYMALYGLDESFFGGSGGEMPLSEFSEKAFKCVEVPRGLDTFVANPDSACSTHAMGGTDSQSGDILTAARDKFLSECQGKSREECALKDVTSDTRGDVIKGAFSASIGDQILEDDGQFQTFGILEDVSLAESLETSRLVMDLLSSDLTDGPLNVQPRILSAVSQAVGNVEGGNEERVAAARQAALNHTLDLIVEDQSFPAFEGSDPAKSKAHLREFVAHLSQEKGFLELPGFSYEEIGARLVRFYEESGSETRLFDEGADGQQVLDAATYMTNFIRRVAVGQRIGDYVAGKVYTKEEVQKQREAAGAALAQSKPVTGFASFRERSQELLINPKTTDIDTKARELVEEINGNSITQSFPVIKAAASMLASDSFHDGDMAEVAGYADIMKMFGDFSRKVEQEAARKDSPLTKDQAHHIAGLEFMSALAIKAAQNCNDFHDPTKMKHRFCSPLSDSEYGISALENLMKDANSGKGDFNTVSLAMTYCSPIMVENKLRELEGLGTSQNTFDAHLAMNDICREQAGRIFCNGECSERDVEGSAIKSTLETVFGPQCSHAREDLQIGVMGGDETFDPNKALKNANGRGPSTGRSIFSNISVRSKEPKIRVKRGGVAYDPSTISVKDRVISARGNGNEKGSSYSRTPASELPTSSMIGGNMAQNQPSKNFMANALKVPSEEEGSLSKQLEEKRDALDPATQALLDRLEQMEKRQNQLQAELKKSREAGDEEGDEGRSELLQELARLKKQIPELENKLREKKDVRTALAAPKPKATTSSSFQNDFTRRSNRRPASTTSSSNRGNATAGGGQSQIAPSSSVTSGSFDEGSSSVRTSSGVRTSVRSGGDGGIAGSSLGGSSSNGAVITMTKEIRERARIFDAGISPQEAVLQARGPVLIPQGDGEFMMYEPELTADGEVLTRDGEVVFKAVVRVSETEVPNSKGRVPASMSSEEPQVDPEYDPRRLRELDMFLNNLETAPVITP